MLLLAQPTFADAWPQPRGHGYYKIGFRMLRATHFYEPNGNRIRIPTVGDYTVSFYGEYGLTDRITLVAYVPFYERITLNRQVGRNSGFVFSEGDVVNGIADPIISARIGLAQFGGTVVSASLRLGLPLGNADQPNGLLTGDGELNQTVALEAGHSFYPAPVYAKASFGFNQRMKGFSDEIVYAVEAGYTIDIRGRMGRRDVRAHYQTIRLQAIVTTDESEERLAEVVEETEARCPVFNLITDAGVKTEMVWLRKPASE